MKNFLYCLLLLLPIGLSAQSWEKINVDSVKHPFKIGNANGNHQPDSVERMLEMTNPKRQQLGSRSRIKQIENKSVVYYYENGFAVYEDSQFYPFLFSEFDGVTDILYPGYVLNNNVPLVYDNGRLFLDFYNSETFCFTYYKGEAEFHGAYPAKYNGDEEAPYYFYKNFKDNKSLFAIVSFEFENRNSYLTVTNRDNNYEIVPLPTETVIPDIAIDSQYIWIQVYNGDVYRYQSNKLTFKNILVKGKIYYDLDKSGSKGASEPGVNIFPVVIQPLGLTLLPSLTGDFSFLGEIGENYSLHIPADSLFDYTSVSLPYTLNLFGLNEVGVRHASPYYEIASNLYMPWPRCNRENETEVKIINTGFKNISYARVALVGDGLLTLTSDNAYSKSGDTLFFKITDLLIGQSQNIKYKIGFPSASNTGNIVELKLITDIYEGNKIVKSVEDSFSGIVRCSFDPNDKSVNPIGVFDEKYTLKGSTLDYLIRFENTGNDTAYHVTVYDTLSTNLDWSTLKVLGSSHSMVTRINQEGVVVFYFENIMLPDSTTNKEKAQGYVRFSIQHEEEIEEGAIVKNVAAIVFDENEPVITNEVMNTLVTTLPFITSNNEVNNDRQILYPNPTTDYFTVKGLHGEVEILNQMGQLVMQSDSESTDVSLLSKGLYWVRIYNSEKELIGEEKLIKY